MGTRRSLLPRAPQTSVGALLDRLETQGIECHSLVVVRGGSVVAEGWWAPYSADRPHLLHSLTKSFTAIAVGLAVDDGLLALDGGHGDRDMKPGAADRSPPATAPAGVADDPARRQLTRTRRNRRPDLPPSSAGTAGPTSVKPDFVSTRWDATLSSAAPASRVWSR
jgi:hypothetical protein